MFLEQTELKTVGVPEVIEKVINNDSDIVTQIIAESIDIMKGYLSPHFDVEAIFNATGNDRSLVVLKYLKDIVIYEIYIRKTHDINEVAEKRYNEAMLWLEKVAKGIIQPAGLPLPESDTDSTGDGFIKFGSQTKYSSNF